MGKIDPELLKRLDALAAKLGTTVEHLWGVLTKQSIAEGIADASVAVLCLLVAIGVALFAFYVFKTRTRTSYKDRRKVDSYEYESVPYTEPYTLWEEWGDGSCALAGVVFFIGICCVVTFVAYGYSATLELYNPEFYAFQHIKDIL